MTVVCTECGWTHFAVTREYAEEEVKSFNTYYEGLDARSASFFGGPSSIEDYETCHCGNKEFKQGNTAPDGSTIGPVIYGGLGAREV